MTNLLHETIGAIERSGHKPEQIAFIGSERSGHSCTWEEFQKLADAEYSSSYGAAEVATDLIVVFSDGAKMWRGEYDGSEWWEYSSPFVAPAERKPITKLIGTLWETLADLNPSDSISVLGKEGVQIDKGVI